MKSPPSFGRKCGAILAAREHPATKRLKEVLRALLRGSELTGLLEKEHQ